MGRQHGEQAATLIEGYIRWIEKTTGQDRDQLGRRALAFAPLIAALNPLLLDEVHGLAEGASIPYEHALLCQARGEAANATPVEGCTAFALRGSATAQGQTLAGQNQDLPPEFADIGIVLHLKPSDGRPRVITFTFAGQLGYMGMNHLGVAHFANGLGDAPWRMGLPHYPLKRTLLEKGDIAACLDILRRHRTSSAGNMVFCDGQGQIADAEIRPEGIALYTDEHPDRRLHTNHYLTSEFAPRETHRMADSVPRLNRIRELVAARWGAIDVAVMQEILADHQGDPGAICRHGEGGSHSICGYIAEPDRGLFHVRRGHGCLGTWTAYKV
jgi:isopenicillin-N N-acyltransferase-like protein